MATRNDSIETSARPAYLATKQWNTWERISKINNTLVHACTAGKQPWKQHQHMGTTTHTHTPLFCSISASILLLPPPCHTGGLRQVNRHHHHNQRPHQGPKRRPPWSPHLHQPKVPRCRHHNHIVQAIPSEIRHYQRRNGRFWKHK